MNTKQKILNEIKNLSEEDIQNQLESGEGICIKIGGDMCVVISMERLIE